jgi:CheY-like chemotaxis protein
MTSFFVVFQPVTPAVTPHARRFIGSTDYCPTISAATVGKSSDCSDGGRRWEAREHLDDGRHRPNRNGAAVSDPGRPLVLVADDNRLVRDLIVFRLERSGYRVAAAENGTEALRMLREQLPDLAILDVMMPNLTGVEVTERIRADEATRHIPVILLTARVQEVDITRGFDAGADDYIRKPFNPQELRGRVQAILGRRRP